MNDQAHFRSLEAMYKAAPINAFYLPEIFIEDGKSEIAIAVSEKLFHSAMAVHGSVYFKMLDDAAFFAANSLEPDYFVLTTSFTTYLTRPVSEGRLRSVGKVVNRTKSQFIAESIVYDSAGNELGRGNGIFVRSKMLLSDVKAYSN